MRQSLSKNDLTPHILSDFDNTALYNNATYLDYYKRLRLLALSMFEWENLPSSMDARYLEESLYFYGMACFCYDDALGWLSLRCTPSAELNIYGEALQYTAYGSGEGYNKVFDRDKIVLVRNNLERIPTDLSVRLFAHRLYECERTIDVNIRAQKTPILIRCDEKQRLTFKNIYQKYDGNEPIIVVDKNYDLSGFEVLKTDSPFVADKLQEYKQVLWSEALSFLGINSTPFEKKAQLVSDEVNSNNQMTMFSIGVMLATRKKACEDFNALTGENISVKIRSYEEYQEVLQFFDPEEPEETAETIKEVV